MQEDILKLITWLFGWTVRLGFKGGVAGTKLGARGTARLLPRATNPAQAIGLTLVAGIVWWGGIVLVGLIIAGKDGFGFFAILGLVVAFFVTFAIGKRQLMAVRAAAGGISLGEQRGHMGVATPHVIDRRARVRHISVFGPTGSGKSTAIKNLVSQDFAAPGNPGVMVVDIKDDLVIDIAKRVPEHRLNDVILFDPADAAFPPAFNPFADVPAESRTLAAAELIAGLKRLYADSWGPRLEHVLRAVVLTLLETPDATLLDISRILSDPDYRQWAVSHVTNFSVQDFWQREWVAIVGAKGSLSNVESLLNKLSIFSYPEIRNCVGQTRRGIDFRRAMDQGKILLFNLPQGKLGEDAAMFLAALVVGKAQLAAQSRVDVPQQFRKPFYLFADEFQNYQTGAFDKLITEGRSMGIGVVAACQYPEQLPTDLRLALQKNCAYALYCTFASGSHNINVVKQQEPDADDAITTLKASAPQKVIDDGRFGQILVQSRISLARPRAEVEADILARMRPAAAGTAGKQTSEPQQYDGYPKPSRIQHTKREIPIDS